jgi:hypothetical protein
VSAPVAIPPDGVKVWRGFRSPSLAQADFLTKLGQVFIPATVELQVAIGLDAYLPTVPAGLPDKPDGVPDESALIFWNSQQTYADGFETLAVRTYTLTHGAVYTPKPASDAQFPVPFAGQLVSNQPYYLVDQPADWMHESPAHALVGRPDSQSPDEFHAAYAELVGSIQGSAGLDGGIVCAGDDYLVFWALGSDAAAAAEQVIGAAGGGWTHLATPEPTSLPAGLWDVWPGMTVEPGASFNMQFKRRWET